MPPRRLRGDPLARPHGRTVCLLLWASGSVPLLRCRSAAFSASTFAVSAARAVAVASAVAESASADGRARALVSSCIARRHLGGLAVRGSGSVYTASSGHAVHPSTVYPCGSSARGASR